MAAQPDAGAVPDGQPGDRLPGPGPSVSLSLEILASALVAEHERASQPFPVPADGTYRFRPGDQQLPVPNDGPSMHDLVIADLGGWPDLASAKNAVRDLLAGRKRIGLERYGSILQAHNDRDAVRDLREELADSAVYARQVQEERGDGPGSAEAFEAYEHILSALFWAMKIPEDGHG